MNNGKSSNSNAAILPITQAALVAGCSPESIYRMIRLRRIKTYGTIRMEVKIEDVERILGRNK